MTSRRFNQGEHFCAVYSTPEERDALAAAFICEGLEHGEQCLDGALCADDLEVIGARLLRAGVDVPAATKRGALLRLTPEDAPGRRRVRCRAHAQDVERRD